MSLIKRRIAENMQQSKSADNMVDFKSKNNVIQPIYDFAPSKPDTKTRLVAGLLALRMVATPVTTAVGLMIANNVDKHTNKAVVAMIDEQIER